MKKISIIVPVFNEEATIGIVLDQLLAGNFGGWEKEIIIVDDGSNDGTTAVLENFRNRLVLIRHLVNCGKGAAIRTAFKWVTGNAVIVQDADLEYSPADIPRLLETLETKKTDAVFGSRELNPSRRGYPHYVLGVRFLTALVNLRFGTQLTDVYTGYKLLRADAAKTLELKSEGFEIEMELTVKLLKRGYRVMELAIDYHPRTFGEGKKIRFGDAVRGLIAFVRYGFLGRFELPHGTGPNTQDKTKSQGGSNKV